MNNPVSVISSESDDENQSLLENDALRNMSSNNTNQSWVPTFKFSSRFGEIQFWFIF